MRGLTTVLVHPSRLFSEGLRRILAGTHFQLNCVAASPDRVPMKFLNTGRDLLFVVGGMDLAGTAENVRVIVRQHASARVAVIGDRGTASEVMCALEAGASAYLRDTMNCKALVKALELVMLDQTVLPAQFIKELVTRELASVQETITAMPATAQSEDPAQQSRNLSSREASILDYLVKGVSNKDIARNLVITEATVKVHVKAILRKIRVKNRTQAAIWAMKHPLNGTSLAEHRAPLVLPQRADTMARPAVAAAGRPFRIKTVGI
jgi:two-component system, NarL family, nitrate/nitrite response regulator NarL